MDADAVTGAQLGHIRPAEAGFDLSQKGVLAHWKARRSRRPRAASQVSLSEDRRPEGASEERLGRRRQQPALLFAERVRRDQVGAACSSHLQGLAVPPAGDRLVVAGEQHRGDRLPFPVCRAGPLRVFEAPRRERFLAGGERAAEDAGDEARHRLDDRRRRHLAARQDEVADPQLLVDQPRRPLVDPFVAPTDQGQVRLGRQRAGARLIEQRPAGRQQDAARGAARGGDRLQRGGNRLDAEDHPRPAAIGGVVHLSVAPRGKVARVRAVNRQHAGLDRAADHRGRKEPGHDLGEQGDDLDRQRGRCLVGIWSCVIRRRPSGPGSYGRGRRRSARSPAPAGSAVPSPLAPLASATVRTSWAPFQNVPTATPSARPASSSTAQPGTSST